MKCLILAAGRGSRLSQRGDSKPLIRLLGLSLIERVILTAQRSGLTEFYVVTGYNGERVNLFLEQFSQKRNIKIINITNEEWKKGNGLSVLKAKKLLNEKFILLMADHIFDQHILERLKQEYIQDDEVMLAVDYNTNSNSIVDFDDVTKVLVNSHQIIDIGKNISSYTAYDTGIFLCSPAIFTAIETSIADNNDSSLSGGIKTLAERGRVRAFDIKDSHWIDVDDERAFQKAEKLLCDKLAKPTDGLISQYINRKFSLLIFTPLLLKIYKGVTPNQVSILSFIIALISSISFSLGHAITGGLLIQISSILDGCDGEIARLKNMQSTLGNFVDAILDRYADGFILLGMFYYSLVAIGGKEILGIYWSPLIISSISILAILGNLMVSYSSAKSVVNFGYRYKGRWIAAGRGRDLRLFVLFIGGVMTCFHPICVFLALSVIALQTNVIVIWRTLLSWNYSTKESAFRMTNRIKAVVFDFDGTLANTMPFLMELAVKLITTNHNISKKEAKKKYLETTGMDFASQLELIFPDHPENQEMVTTFESKKLMGIFDHPIFPEVLPTLNYLKKRKIKTFICSSTKQKIITKYCELNRIGNLVDSCLGHRPGFGKSEQVEFVLQHFKIQPNEVFFVGDSLRDYDFIKDKKINFIGISRIFSKVEFQKRGLFSVNSLTALVKLFDKSEKTFSAIEEVKPCGDG